MTEIIGTVSSGKAVSSLDLQNRYEDFIRRQKEAVEKIGTVKQNLSGIKFRILRISKQDFDGNSLIIQLKHARQWAIDNLVTKKGDILPKTKDGTEYEIGKSAVGKFFSSISLNNSEDIDTHLSVLKWLKDVIRISEDVEIHPDYNKGIGRTRSINNGYSDNVLIHRLYGAVIIDEDIYRVKTTMKEYLDVDNSNKAYNYEVTKIELLEPKVGTQKRKTTETRNSISSAKLLKGVEKSYDKGKKLLDESE